MARYKDRTNQRFGRLVAISYAGNRLVGKNDLKLALWLCKCDCGNEKVVPAHSLTHNLTKSCGCLHSEQGKVAAKKFSHKAWASKTLPLGEAVRNEVLQGYKRHCVRRGHEWLVSDDQFFSLMDDNCHYCGIEPSTIRTRMNTLRTNIFKYNGVDRIDNEIGYVPGNVVTCCELCNYSKRSLTYKEFNDHLDRIGKFRASKLTNVVPIVEVQKIS